MNTPHPAALAALVLIATAAPPGCGGRTQGAPEAVGHVIGNDAGLPPRQDRDSATTTPAMPPSMTSPGPTLQPTTTTAPTPTMATTSTPPAPSGVIVSPPHDTGCAVVESEERPAFAYTYSDNVTRIELSTSDGSQSWCVEGTAGPAGPDYVNWGAAMGLFVGSLTENGHAVAFDAKARGIVGVRFNIDLSGRPLRLMLSEVNSPLIIEPGYNYEANPYTWGYPPPDPLHVSGTYEVRFEDFHLPPWTQVPDEHQRPLDAARLHTLHLLVANNPDDLYDPFRFCVWDVQWVDACGNPVDVSVATGMPAVIPTPTISDPSTAPPPTSDPGDNTSLPPEVSSEVVWPDSTSAPSATRDVVVVHDAGVEDTATDDTAPEPSVLDASVL